MNVKLSIATWYGCCREKIVEDNPEVFSGSGEEARYGLLSIMRTIAQGAVHGNFSDVEKLKVNMVMMELNEVVEEGKRTEKAYSKNGL